jgi:hypothetical protein
MGPVDEGDGSIEVGEGDEHVLSFSFYVQPTAYRLPGAENLIMRFSSESSAPPTFGLQLWDDGSGGRRGLWSSGDAMDGERFLAPVGEEVWHEVTVYFQASSEDSGFYLLLLDGQPIDARAWVSLIEPGDGHALLETGLFRDGENPVDPDVFVGPTQLEESVGSVLP